MEKSKLDKKLEKEIKKDVEEEVKDEVEDKLGKKLSGELEKELKPEIEKEIKKRIHQRIYESGKKSAWKFQKEFREQTAVAITASFAFLIALSWRAPIEKGVNVLIERAGLEGSGLFLEFLSALAITLIAVIFLMIFSRWKSEKK